MKNDIFFYIFIFILYLLCILGIIYAIYTIVKNREHYSLKNIWKRSIEEKESQSISSHLLKIFGIKPINITSRKFDAIFGLIILIIFTIIMIATSVVWLLEKITS